MYYREGFKTGNINQIYMGVGRTLFIFYFETFPSKVLVVKYNFNQLKLQLLQVIIMPLFHVILAVVTALKTPCLDSPPGQFEVLLHNGATADRVLKLQLRWG